MVRIRIGIVIIPPFRHYNNRLGMLAEVLGCARPEGTKNLLTHLGSHLPRPVFTRHWTTAGISR